MANADSKRSVQLIGGQINGPEGNFGTDNSVRLKERKQNFWMK